MQRDGKPDITRLDPDKPAHLQKLAEKSLESKERDIFRAEYVREKLKN